MKKFRKLSEELTPSSKPEAGRQAVGGRFTSGAPKGATKPAPLVTSEENISEIIMTHVKSDLSTLDKTSFVKKHGISKSVAKSRVTEAKDEEEYGYEGDMAMNQLKTIIRHSEYLMDMMKPDTDLPEWVQSKITLATDYIQTACDYMTSEMNEAKEVGDIPSGDENPQNVGTKKGKTVVTNPVMEASSAAVRMQRALDKIKQSREASERRAKELLNPKKPEPVKEGHQVVATTKQGETFKSGIHPTKEKALSQHYKMAKSGNYKKIDTVKTEEVEQIEEDSLDPNRMDNRNRTVKRNIQARLGHDERGDARVRAGQPRSTHMRNKPQLPEEVEQIEEGRPSQRHPLEGHEYHKKSDEALIHIAKDAHAAAEAMKSHNTTAENKYRDQANDSATVRHFRKTSGMPDWYKKKYGHMKEEMECNQSKAGVKCNVHGMKDCTPGQIKETFRPMDEPNYNNSIQARQKKADDANKPPFDGPYKKSTGVVTDKSGAKHGGMSIARHIAREAMKKQASKMSVKESLEESRKAEIVKEIMKKGKKKEDNTFQGEPELGSTVVKADT